MWETNNLLSAYSRQSRALKVPKSYSKQGAMDHNTQYKQHFPSIDTLTSLINLILVHSKHFFNSPNFTCYITQEYRTRIHKVKFHLRETLPLQRSQMALISFTNHLNWKWIDVFWFEKHIQTTDHLYQQNQCDARVLENWQHNHYMCAKIGQSKFHRKILSEF